MIVYFQDNGLIIDKRIAEQLELTEYSIIESLEHFCKILEMNARYNIIILTQQIENNDNDRMES